MKKKDKKFEDLCNAFVRTLNKSGEERKAKERRRLRKAKLGKLLGKEDENIS